MELQSCFDTVNDHVNGDADCAISEREIYNFKRMIDEIAEFLRENDLLDEDGEINQTALDDICNFMREEV